MQDSLGLDYCSCPEGYGHDMMIYHNFNCAMPQYVTPLFSTLFFVLWLGVLIVFETRRRILVVHKSHFVLNLTRVTLVYHIVLGGVVAGMAIQGGFFEISCVFALPLLTLMGLIPAMMLRETLNASSTMLEKHTGQRGGGGFAVYARRYINPVVQFLVVYNFGIGVAMVWNVRSFNSDVFVTATKACYTGFIFTFGILAYRTMGNFAEELKQVDTTAVKVFRIRVLAMRKRMVSSSLMHTLSAVVSIIARVGMGSFPFQWVFTFTSALASLLVTLGVVQMMMEDTQSPNAQQKQRADSAMELTSENGYDARTAQYVDHLVGSQSTALSSSTQQQD